MKVSKAAKEQGVTRAGDTEPLQEKVVVGVVVVTVGHPSIHPSIHQSIHPSIHPILVVYLSHGIFHPVSVVIFSPNQFFGVKTDMS